MACCPDDMYLNDEDKLIGRNKNVRFGGPWDYQTYDPKKPTKPSSGAKPYNLQTFPDDSSFRSNGTSSFGFMI